MNSVLDLVADLIEAANRSESPKSRPLSPENRPAKTVVAQGFSPESPKSQACEVARVHTAYIWSFKVDGKAVTAIDHERSSYSDFAAFLDSKFGLGRATNLTLN